MLHPFMSKIEFSDIDRLHDQDASNVDECKRLLVEISPEIPDAINLACSLYTTANRVYGQAIGDHFGEVERLLDARGMQSDSELIPIAETDPEVRNVLARFQSRDARGLLLVRLGVLNSQLFADFLRLRLTSPFAYLRIQAESVALLQMMTRDPHVAVEWSDIRTNAQGVAFFNKSKREVRLILEQIGLLPVYEMASSFAVHSRFSGVAMASKFSHKSEDGSWERRLEVRAQEFDPDDPVPFLMSAVYGIKTQDLIFAALLEILPELDDPIFRERRVPAFRACVSRIVSAVQRYRPIDQ